MKLTAEKASEKEKDPLTMRDLLDLLSPLLMVPPIVSVRLPLAFLP